MRRKSKNIVLENIKLVSAGAKGVAVGRIVGTVSKEIVIETLEELLTNVR